VFLLDEPTAELVSGLLEVEADGDVAEALDATLEEARVWRPVCSPVDKTSFRFVGITRRN